MGVRGLDGEKEQKPKEMVLFIRLDFAPEAGTVNPECTGCDEICLVIKKSKKISYYNSI